MKELTLKEIEQVNGGHPAVFILAFLVELWVATQ